MKKTFSAILILGSIIIPALVPVQAKSASLYGPMAKCKDGTYSYSQNHRGTCSHHGGVRVWYR